MMVEGGQVSVDSGVEGGLSMNVSGNSGKMVCNIKPKA
jgi:hypothetical protein